MVSDTILFGGQIYRENGESNINNSCKIRILNFLFIKRIKRLGKRIYWLHLREKNSLEKPQLTYIFIFPYIRL